MKKLFLLACSLFIISASHADEKEEIQQKSQFLQNITVRPYYSEKISTIDATLYGQTQDLNNTTIIIENAETQEVGYYYRSGSFENQFDLNELEEGVYIIRIKLDGKEYCEYFTI